MNSRVLGSGTWGSPQPTGWVGQLSKKSDSPGTALGPLQMAAPKVSIALDAFRVRPRVVLDHRQLVGDPPPPVTGTKEYIAAVGPDGISLEKPASAPKKLVIPLPSAAPVFPAVAAGDALVAPGSDRALSEEELTKLAVQSLVEDARTGADREAVLAPGPKLIIAAVAAVVESDVGGQVSTTRGLAPRGSDADAELRDRLFRPDQQRVRGAGPGGAAPMLMRQQASGAPAPGAAAAPDLDRERLAADLVGRAQDLEVTGEAYDAVPIAEFGAAMLRGMGVAEAVIAADAGGPGGSASDGPRARPQGLGLGAQPAPALEAEAARHKKTVRPGDPPAGGAAASRKFPGVVAGALVQVR